MINSNDYYTESEVQVLFGYAQKSTTHKFRSKVHTYQISNRWYYSRKDVDKVLQTLSAEKQAIATVVKRDVVKDYNLDLSRYVSMREALQILGVSRQRLYQLCDTNKVKFVMFDGYRLFEKESLKQRERLT